MKYFGTLDRDKFENEPTEKQDDILVLLNYFKVGKETGDISIRDAYYDHVKVSLKTIIRPTKLLVYDFYDFLILRYKDYIDEQFLSFFLQFNEEVYGKSKKNHKKRALYYFNEIYKEFSVDGIKKFKRKVSVRGIVNIEAENKMHFLYKRREALKYEIANRSFLLEYLYGNLNYFDSLLMNENKVLNEFIAFEFQLKKLISLNDKFGFESDLYFSKMGVLKETFENFKHIFPRLEIFLKVHSTIDNLDHLIPAHIDSLYPVLVKLNLIKDSKKEFMSYLLKVHEIKKHNIPIIDEMIQLEHAKRMQTYTSEFKELATNK
ncbi:hypothetical protein [Xanthomarina sp. GH4-25]|uniref:hypothetical protein n=1 Tax=Xanthomarina sp. GH4-25 TaxID=3349335 RepID=UPI003877D5A1